MALEDLMGKSFGIDPNESYERKQFVEEMGRFFDFSGYYNKLKESKGTDLDSLQDLAAIASGYMVGKKEKNFDRLTNDPTMALKQGKCLVSAGEEKTAKFVENHRDSLLDKLSAEQLYVLFTSVPLYETGDKEHNRIRDVREKIRNMEQIADKRGDIGSVVQEEVKELIEKAPPEQKVFISMHRDAVRDITEDVVEGTHKEYQSLFRDKEGKLDKSALIKYLTENYEAAIREMNALPEKERAGFWSDNLKLPYLMLAQQLYFSENKEQKKEDDPEKEARNEKLAGKGYST